MGRCDWTAADPGSLASVRTRAVIHSGAGPLSQFHHTHVSYALAATVIMESRARWAAPPAGLNNRTHGLQQW